ncbi:unnamed protein product [Brassica oleracea]
MKRIFLCSLHHHRLTVEFLLLGKLITLKHQMGGAISHVPSALGNCSVGFHPSCVDPIMMKKLLAFTGWRWQCQMHPTLLCLWLSMMR